MIKKIITYISVIGFLFFVGLKTHQYFVNKQHVSLSFSLQSIYTFHAIFTLIVLIKFKIISSIDKVSEQLGFIYLAVLVLKIIFFSILFYNPILSSEELTQVERISLLIPTVIFLITEVYFVAKMLNKK